VEKTKKYCGFVYHQIYFTYKLFFHFLMIFLIRRVVKIGIKKVKQIFI
jgi:hypothetical protein